MNAELSKEIIYLLIRIHQISAYAIKNPDAKTVIAMLRATKLSKELKEWLNDRMGAQTDQTFIAAVTKMFQGQEVKLTGE